MAKESIGYLQWVCPWHAGLGMLPIKSTAATYSEKNFKKEEMLK